MLRRRKWSILACGIVVGALIGGFSAMRSTTTTSRSPVSDGALGGLIGVLLGVGIAYTLEDLDERVRSSDEIERVTHLPVLAELPRDERSKKDRARLAVFDSPKSPLGEAVRALRASIELRRIDGGSQSLLVTSAASGEGKSLVSANLAAAYALAGYRTVLVDGDLRTPRLSSMFGTYSAPLVASGEAVHGLASLVQELTVSGADRHALEQAALLRTAIDNLLFLPAGPEPAYPAELLDSREMAVLLADLAAIADVVIIDAPSLLPVSDAAGLARWANAVLLVAAVGESNRNALRRARKILAPHPRVLGIVANKVAAVATYPTHRRAASKTPELAPHLLNVVRRLDVTPPISGRGANGDIWIDLSEEPEPNGQHLLPGTLQVSSWSR